MAAEAFSLIEIEGWKFISELAAEPTPAFIQIIPKKAASIHFVWMTPQKRAFSGDFSENKRFSKEKCFAILFRMP